MRSISILRTLAGNENLTDFDYRILWVAYEASKAKTDFRNKDILKVIGKTHASQVSQSLVRLSSVGILENVRRGHFKFHDPSKPVVVISLDEQKAIADLAAARELLAEVTARLDSFKSSAS